MYPARFARAALIRDGKSSLMRFDIDSSRRRSVAALPPSAPMISTVRKASELAPAADDEVRYPLQQTAGVRFAEGCGYALKEARRDHPAFARAEHDAGHSGATGELFLRPAARNAQQLQASGWLS